MEEVAKSLCGQCPFANDCLDYALTARETSGIWGGLTARERLAMLRRMN